MPASRKRKRLASPEDSWRPTDVPRLRCYFSEHGLDVTAPCTASLSSTTADATQRSCWVVGALGLWNSVLHPVGIQLREDASGTLRLDTFAKCNPSKTEYRAVAAFLVMRLLAGHHCVQQLSLGYSGKLFGEGSQAMSQVRPVSSVHQITLDGGHVRRLEFCELVQAMLLGDPLVLQLHRVSLRAADITALTKRLTTWTRLTELDLSENRLSGRESVSLVGAIEACVTIRVLKLDHNMIGVRGAQRLARLLESNNTLLSVSLVKTKIKDKGAVAIGNALAANRTLQELLVAGNDIGTAGARAFASSLKLNTSLMRLDMARNTLGDRGAAFLAQALQSNQTLRELRLCMNRVDDDGTVAIANSLVSNRTLVFLSISDNEFTEDGVTALARLVAQNETLTQLNLTSIFVWSPGRFSAFADALALNRSLRGVEIHLTVPSEVVTLSQRLRCHETLRDLSIYSSVRDLRPLFDSLASNRSVRSLKLERPSFMGFDDIVAFANLLRATTALRSVTLVNRVGENHLTEVVRGLASNASIWTFHAGCFGISTNFCTAIADMLRDNSTLSAFVLDHATTHYEVSLRTLASGLSSNRSLLQLRVSYPASSAAGFSISERLRGNNALMSHAVRFALGKVTDKSSAAAFQLYQRSEFFVHELSLHPEVMCESSAKALILQAIKYIVQNYFVVTGVVNRALVCVRRRRDMCVTQFDNLNLYCLYEIAAYLKVSDVKG